MVDSDSLQPSSDVPPQRLNGVGSPATSAKRKPPKACLRCRKRKVKCAGGRPCPNCGRGGHDCQYDVAKKVLISEIYLKELEQGASRASDTNVTQANHLESTVAPESTEDNLANPLTNNDTTDTTLDLFGGQHFVGLSSTWGFAWRIRRLLSSLPLVANNDHPEVDDVAYTKLVEQGSIPTQDAYSLPRETAERYLSNYAYHVAPVWHFIDTSNLFSSLTRDQNPISDHRFSLCQVQFNLVMAVGKLLEHNGKSEQSPGEAYLYFALSLMKTMDESMSIAREPILVSQNYCLIAFYFHAVNMRNDAYVNVGKAMRIAFTQGLHRLSPSSMDDEGQESRVRFWWSLYSLDILMGAPVSVHIDEVTTRDPLPHVQFRNPTALMQCVKMARLTALVLFELYGRKGHDRNLFVRSIRKILDNVNGILNSMPSEYKIEFESTPLYVSRTSATLYLFLYQTLIVAVRPVLFHLVEHRVKRIMTHGPASALAAPSSSIRQLLKKMVDAAVRSMQILSSVRFQSQLQTFLAFDVTAAFSSAVIISLAMFVSSKSADQENHINEALRILKELGEQGNIAAQKRMYELESLRRDLRTALQGNNLEEDGTQEFRNVELNAGVPQLNRLAPSLDMYDYGTPGTAFSFPSWDDGSANMLLNEDMTEGFEAFFSQVEQYPEVISFQ